MKQKILVPLAILVLTAVGALGFVLIQKQKKPEISTPVVAEPPPVVTDPTPDDQLKDVPTRPATAEEVKLCDTRSPLGEGIGPVERTWHMGRNNALEEDICLASYTIHLKNNKTKLIGDVIIDPDEFHANSIHHIHTYMKEEGFFLVSNDFMENGSFFLVNDETGDETYIECSPAVFSPNKMSFFSFCTDSDGESSNSSVGIWNRVNGSMKVYQVNDFPWTPANLKWADDNTVTLDRQTRDTEGVTTTVPAKITRTGDTWVMDPPAK